MRLEFIDILFEAISGEGAESRLREALYIFYEVSSTVLISEFSVVRAYSRPGDYGYF